MVTERIDEIISDKALSSFDQLSEKLNRSVTEFEKLIEKSVEANRVMGASKSIKELADATAKLEEAEKSLGKQQAELNAANQKLNDLYKQLEEKAKAMAKAQMESAKALGESSRQGDFVAQSLDEIKKSGETATKIFKEFSSDIQENIKRQLSLRSELAKVKEEQKAVTKVINEWGDAAGDQTAVLGELAEREAVIKAELREVNTLVNQQAREIASNEGSINQFTATLDRLQLTYKTLSKEQRESDQGQSLLKAIQQLDPAIKGFNESTGQFQRSVGNYAKASLNFGQSLGILEKAFQDVKKRMDDANTSSNANEQVVEALRKEYELLERILNNQTIGFASATAQVKENEKALQALGAAGLENTQFYQDLLKDTASLKDNVGDLKNEIKNLASDTKTLDGIVGTVQLLAGTYAVATESLKVFGVESEDLQEAQQKSQAIIAVLNGLQAIQNALQSDSAVIIFLNTIRTKALTLAQRAFAFATTASSRAVAGLRAALIASGLGALLVLLPAVAQAMANLADKTSRTREEQDKLNEAVKGLNDNLAEQSELTKKTNEANIRGLKDQLAIAEARGSSEEELLALKLKIAAAEKAAREEELQDLKSTENQVISLQGNRLRALEKLKVAQELYQQDVQKGDERGQKASKIKIDDIQKEIDVIDSKLIPAEKALQDAQDAGIDLERVRGEQRKFLLSERQKQLQTERLTLQFNADVASQIAADETKSYGDRLRALSSFSTLQRKIILNTRDEKLIDPTLSTQAKLQAEKDANLQLRKIDLDFSKQSEQLRKVFQQRERAARIAILTQTIEDNAKANDRIAEDEKKSFDERTSALYKAFEGRRGLLILERNEELKNIKLTTEEKLAIEYRYASEINELTVQFGQQQLALVKANEEAITAAIEKENKRRSDVISTQANKQIADLISARINGSISAQKFERALAVTQAKERIKQLSEAVRAEQAKVAATKEGTAERAAAEQALSEKVVEYGTAIKNLRELERGIIAENIEQIREYGTTILGLIGGVISASIDKQKNALQELSDQIDKNKAREIEAINATTLSAEEKAARIKIIESTAANQKEQIERRQRQLDQRKAEFEKAQAIATIILNTAVAISKALGNPFAIAVNAALGAAQLAIAISTPIPKYKDGTLDHPGGDAIVGDGWRSELAITPDGKMIKTPAVPTVMNLPEHTVVLPDFRQAMESGVIAGVATSGYRDTGNTDRSIREMSGQITKELRKIRNKKPIVIKNRSGWDIIVEGDNGSNYLNKKR